MKKLLLLFVFISTVSAYAQDTLPRPHVTIKEVDVTIMKEMAKTSGKKKTLFYTFGSFCEPCYLHLSNAIKLAKDYDLDFYVLLVEPMTSDGIKTVAGYLYGLDKTIKIAVLSDDVYGVRTKKRNKQFVKEITPANLEAIADFGKYILLDNTGEVIMVTTYKDNKGNDWHDDSKMVEKTLVPLLQ